MYCNAMSLHSENSSDIKISCSEFIARDCSVRLFRHLELIRTQLACEMVP